MNSNKYFPNIPTRGTRYVFESLNDVKFISNDEKAYDSTSGQV